MLDRPNADVTDRITTLVRRIMEKNAISGPLGRNDDLRASGLSSLDIVNLMLAIESEFGLRIPEREMTPTNFRSIARAAELVVAVSRTA